MARTDLSASLLQYFYTDIGFVPNRIRATRRVSVHPFGALQRLLTNLRSNGSIAGNAANTQAPFLWFIPQIGALPRPILTPANLSQSVSLVDPRSPQYAPFQDLRPY
ncbi:hypothetical protein CVT26_003605 [Gymnopilus dilepis]|uniref:Uncharacterized protein n=1 Tax=Gymnopilus dilepis TaxID=231916 RepID=A0A409W1Y7_9AGAR|nr:hypothetical protein CVT26_003605 [Gymnopilus dilepis]